MSNEVEDYTVSQETILFFGCINRAGHFLWLPNMQRIGDAEARKMNIPTAGQLDGTCFFLPHPEKIGSGHITYLPAPNLTILAWWGNNPWDNRGAVNSAIITNGRLGEIGIWGRFERHFTELSTKLKRPLLTGD